MMSPQGGIRKIRFLFVFVFFMLVANIIYSESFINIESYEVEYDFSELPLVYIQKGDNPEYRMSDYNDSEWEVISLPSAWDEVYPDYNGICWYRIHIKFPKDLPIKSVGINLGTITDADEAYFNGELIGRSGRVDPPEESAYDKLRLYEIPTSLI